MPWEGYNHEDALISERLVQEDYTSIHIEKYEIEGTKRSSTRGNQEI